MCIRDSLDNRAVAAYEESPVSRTFSPEWIESHGLPEHKKSLKKTLPVLRYLQRVNARSFPNVIIRWHDGIRMKEIVVRGFYEDEKKERQYASNLYALLKQLKKVVYRR